MKRWISANGLLLRSLLSDLDTPTALAVSLLLENKEWDQLATKWVDPSHYPEGIFSALKYRRDVQAVDLLRKAPLPTTINRVSAALAAWEDAETACYNTNEFLDSLDSESSSKDAFKVGVRNFLRKCQKTMGRWLGPLPDELDGGFGPGTCVEYTGSNPTVVDKIWLTPTTTPDAAALFEWHYSRTLWGRVRWGDRLGAPGISRGNRLTTVPKDGKTDRPISIEPVGNLWLQLGIGRHLKRRLALIGLPDYCPAQRELFPGYEYKSPDAQAFHRELLKSCRSKRLATIDLSSASDTVARSLVERLLPPDWYVLLDSCRSQKTFIPLKGRRGWRHIEKFSSMGNGFTFELESLVFTVLLSVGLGLTPGVNLWVFGDDIILPQDTFSAACNILECFGFTPNRRKSYSGGPFFESCGGNVHSDVEVTPVRIKEPFEDFMAVYAFHNACFRRGFSRRSLRLIRDLIPRKLRFAGPEHLGDSVLHGLPFTPERRPGLCSQQTWVKTLRLRPSCHIPLDRWSEELSVVALLLGSTHRVVRRGTDTIPVSGWASVS